jgi:Phage integrase family
MTSRAIRFLAETGIRQEEVCSLEWSQVSIPRREVRLTKTKTSSPRVVPLSDAALGTLIGTPRHLISPYVFWHADGQRYTNFANSFALVARRAGVPFRCHDLRHASASTFLQATGDIPALQAILGHKTIAMTMRYAHIVTSHLYQAIAEFAAKTGAKSGTGETVSNASAHTTARRPGTAGRGIHQPKSRLSADASIHRILAATSDIEQEEPTNNADVFVEVDRVRRAGGAIHGPEVVRDERGSQCIEREQEGQRARPCAEGDRERDEELDHNRHEGSDGGYGGADVRHVTNSR